MLLSASPGENTPRGVAHLMFRTLNYWARWTGCEHTPRVHRSTVSEEGAIYGNLLRGQRSLASMTGVVRLP